MLMRSNRFCLYVSFMFIRMCYFVNSGRLIKMHPILDLNPSTVSLFKGNRHDDNCKAKIFICLRNIRGIKAEDIKVNELPGPDEI